MIVFVTGATGTLGQPVVRLLVEAGHEVRALSRSARNDALISDLGSTPLRADLFQPDSLRAAITGTDAVMHLASKIPPLARIGRRAAWQETDAIRREGTQNLVAAALKNAVETFIYPSVAFLYPASGNRWIDTETQPEPAAYMLTTLEAEAEVARFAAHGRRGVSLRMGSFYDLTSSLSRQMAQTARLGISPVFGRDDAYAAYIWVEDAARAVIAALDAPSGVYDIVDDEPMTRKALRGVIAQALGRRRLWQPPHFLASAMLGVTADALTRSQRVSNARFKAVTSWTPLVPSAREGWALIAKNLVERPS